MIQRNLPPWLFSTESTIFFIYNSVLLMITWVLNKLLIMHYTCSFVETSNSFSLWCLKIEKRSIKVNQFFENIIQYASIKIVETSGGLSQYKLLRTSLSSINKNKFYNLFQSEKVNQVMNYTIWVLEQTENKVEATLMV